MSTETGADTRFWVGLGEVLAARLCVAMVIFAALPFIEWERL
jgi:hypothetical protein